MIGSRVGINQGSPTTGFPVEAAVLKAMIS